MNVGAGKEKGGREGINNVDSTWQQPEEEKKTYRIDNNDYVLNKEIHTRNLIVIYN